MRRIAAATPTLRIRDDMRLRDTVVSFHILWTRDSDGHRRPVWAARRIHADGRSGVRGYTDSRRCPALPKLLALAEGLERPAAYFPHLDHHPRREEEFPNVLLHGAAYTLDSEGVFQGAGTRGVLRVTGDELTPLGAWGEALEAALAACWSADAPKLTP
jgi:hypothetical protein